jgi:hypothetical protein
MRGSFNDHHPSLGLVDVFAATLPTLKFTPGVHINYAETVLPMRDGLPKLKDFLLSSADRASGAGPWSALGQLPSSRTVSRISALGRIVTKARRRDALLLVYRDVRNHTLGQSYLRTACPELDVRVNYRSPNAWFPKRSLNFIFWILPVAVCGISSTKTISSGSHHLATLSER